MTTFIPDSPSASIAPAAFTDTPPLIAAPTPFFAVSLLKFSLMSVCTFGLYELYWFYKNWVLIRDRDKSRIQPALRAFFAFFYCWSFFNKVRDTSRGVSVGPALPSVACGIGWIVATLATKAADPYWLVSLLAFVFLLPVQVHINRINQAAVPGHDRNQRFSAWNGAAMALGGLMILAVVIGSFLPTEV